MGAKSTIDIKRKNAIAFILSALYGLTDDELGDVLESINDVLWDKGQNSLGLHNFRVISDRDDSDSSEID